MTAIALLPACAAWKIKRNRGKVLTKFAKVGIDFDALALDLQQG
jgi:hypothetical protein